MKANWKSGLLKVGMLAALCAPAWAQDYEFYAVKPNDTVEKLALTQRVSTESILKLNPAIKEGVLPAPGSIIFLPTAAPLPVHKPVHHTVSHKSEPASARVESHKSEVAHSEPIRGGIGGELSEEEVDALYEGTVKPLGGRVAEVAVVATAAALPEHQNTITTSDGQTISVPQARPRPKPTAKSDEEPEYHRRGLSSRRGIQAQEVLRSALKCLGIPYVWGGESPTGYDCSGFVQHVYASCGISLPRTADLQFNIGRVVPNGKEQPGDLIFFETYCPGPSHIGIFLGRHQFVHASSAAGHITISDLREAHFQRCYLGAKRVF